MKIYASVFILVLSILLTGCALVLPQAQTFPDIEESPTVEESTNTNQIVENDSEKDNSLPIFDTHAHYKQEAWDVFSPSEIIQIMERANVPHALVSSTPDEGTRMLYTEDPARIIPFLRPYHGEINSSNWTTDPEMLTYLNSRLEMPIYRGIGEFHLHDIGKADSPTMRETARLAVEQDLYLHIHSGAAAVRTVFEYQPDAKILWAHAGMSEPPAVVSAMMDEYTQLWTDISIREFQIAPDGKLDPAWEALFLRHPDRITVGSDTWVTPRWRTYEQIIEFDRVWLNQLPRDIAEMIAFGNAMRLFGNR
ncbi:MAG: amidohydrolase family protein [Chloroflexota bacterium]